MQTRDRLGWLLSGILLGSLLMYSCSVVDSTPTATSVVDAAPANSQQPSVRPELPPDAPPGAPNTQPVGQGQGLDAYSETVSAIFAKGNPSTVRITVQGDQGSSLGTGFVFNTEGYIVTNYHVIASSGGQVIVEFINAEADVGDVVGFDQDADLAVVKIRNPGTIPLVPAEFGDSSELRVGDVVVAIGNPFGEDRTATAGIISAVRASKKEGNDQTFSIPGVLQTDAAINPGNSGGPLFNARGQVVGVNTFILDPSGRGANIGIGYALPINLVKRVVPELIANQRYVHPFFGAALNNVDSLFARQNNLPTKGVIIQQLYDGPAAKAGLKQGEIITAINGQAMLEAGDLISFLEFNTKPGDTITVTVVSPSGDKRDVKVQVGARE